VTLDEYSSAARQHTLGWMRAADYLFINTIILNAAQIYPLPAAFELQIVAPLNIKSTLLPPAWTASL